ncbi:LTA synthase family protein [Rodentibacter caecimuris]|uniref:LTA synthase family protein n=1 Tax=Rodentibacter caecimuris TaxID=1796644 RepID=UPI0013A0890B|nr:MULTISPECIES: LTA synthase family protein [Pasteurellaceae]MCQ9124390.1 LTA synthase family protein [Rodentibacter heylii]MCR1838082.1 LTA synthase family protein [Pasteurella caecimuris]MCU0107196.1 LTA synthase family protein [Pasteurella caecimuris]MCX2962262.1 LTA synthase family protein [Rodentibacter heylii]QIA77782.1 LTA synthase family protein [Rodentibacter heylii]
MIAYIFLALFTIAAVIFIINSHYRWTYFFAISLFVFFFGGMLALSGQWQRALNFTSVLFVILMLFHRLKIHYYKQPLLISDFFLVVDWRNWETLMHYKGALGGVISLLALLGFAIFAWSDVASLGAIGHIFGAILFTVSFGLMWHYSKNPNALQVWLDSLPDDGRDVFLNLPMSCRGIFFKVPQVSGNGENFAAKMTALSDNKSHSNTETKPDIVVALLESTLNPHRFAFTKQNIPPLPMFERQSDTVFMSPLRVHTFAGATWKSEFAFLAGVPSTDFGALASGVFYSVVPHMQSGLVKNLREQGYFCVVLSPFTKGNYNAKSAYDHFGFDLMLQPQDLGYPAPFSKNLWTISSEEMMDYTRMILEKKHPALEKVTQPMFVYMLTMREHGPYDLEMENIYNLEMPNIGAKSISSLNDYTQRIVALNEAIEKMDEYLHQRNKPFVFGYFGDHQVAFDNAIPAKEGDFPFPDYITQFVVRSNVTTPFKQEQDFLDLAFAGGLLLDVAGLAAQDDFMKANKAMRRLSEGKLEDSPNNQFVNDYRHYLYQTLKIAQ